MTSCLELSVQNSSTKQEVGSTLEYRRAGRKTLIVRGVRFPNVQILAIQQRSDQA